MRLKNIFTKISFIPLILFLILLILVVTGITDYIDESVDSFARTYTSANNTIIFKWITNLGSQYIVIAVCVILVIIPKIRFKYGIVTFCAEAISVTLHQIAKMIIRRPRPEVSERLIDEPGYSFPSGHAMCNITLYVMLAYIGYKMIENSLIRKIFCITSIMIPLIISYSRVYLGVHYFTDVLGGCLFGTWVACIAINFIIEKEKNYDNI